MMVVMVLMIVVMIMHGVVDMSLRFLFLRGSLGDHF